MATIARRPVAERDLEDTAVYIGRNSRPTATRFLIAAEATLARLASMAGMGASFPLTNPRLQGLRHHPIRGFPNHLIFCLPTADGIEVVRVLHGARDLTAILENEP
jgi:toxin ParE1/3/4